MIEEPRDLLGDLLRCEDGFFASELLIFGYDLSVADVIRSRRHLLELSGFAGHLREPDGCKGPRDLSADGKRESGFVFVLWAVDANADEPLAFGQGRTQC